MNRLQVLRQRLAEHPVICAVRTSEDLRCAQQLEGPRCVFLLGTTLREVPQSVSSLSAKGHSVFVHVDLVEGLKPDAAGLSFLAEHAKPAGVISTHRSVVEQAREQGLLTILRVFLLDSEALRKGRQLVSHLRPDLLELLPGVALVGLGESRLREFGAGLIAGGLVEDKSQVGAILKRGVLGVSTSTRSLW